jgi:hypothetical protein
MKTLFKSDFDLLDETTESVEWEISPWVSGEAYVSVDITDIINEIGLGEPALITIEPIVSGARTAHGVLYGTPELLLEYGEPLDGDADFGAFIDELVEDIGSDWQANQGTLAHFGAAITTLDAVMSEGVTLTASIVTLNDTLADVGADFGATLTDCADGFNAPALFGNIISPTYTEVNFLQGDADFGATISPTYGVVANFAQNLWVNTFSRVNISCEGYGAGEVFIELPGINISAFGKADTLGRLSSTFRIVIVSTGYSSASAILNSSIKKPSVSATASTGYENYSIVSLPRISLISSGVAGQICVATSIIRPIRVTSSAHWHYVNGVQLVIPHIVLTSRAAFGTPTCVVMNTMNYAVTEYTEYGYNSMAYFNNQLIGIKPTGVYELTGDSDSGTSIAWSMKTGKVDMDEKVVSKSRYAWISYRPSGDLRLVVDDGEHEYEYDVESYKQIDNAVRVKLGKGIRNRYLQFELSNVSNEKIFLDEIKIFAEPTGKKR